MTRDVALFASVVVSFAILLTAHIAIVFALFARPPRWRALAAFAAVPLAPYYAFREGMRARAILWVAGAIVYAAALGASRMAP